MEKPFNAMLLASKVLTDMWSFHVASSQRANSEKETGVYNTEGGSSLSVQDSSPMVTKLNTLW
jgi:hypothetical protein